MTGAEDAPELSQEQLTQVRNAITSIETSVRALRERQTVSRDEYKGDDRRTLRRATEREFEMLVEASLQLAKIVVRHETGHVPERRRAKIRELATVGVISKDLRDDLLKGVAFRDVLAHTYGPVIDDDKVYDALQTTPDVYVRFADAVADYVEAR